jgi:hypothetical protein
MTERRRYAPAAPAERVKTDKAMLAEIRARHPHGFIRTNDASTAAYPVTPGDLLKAIVADLETRIATGERK